MATTTPNIDTAAVADMESDLQQLRQQNKELRSAVELLTKSQKKGHKKKPSNGNTDDSYQLYRTPEHTPTPSDDSAASNSKLKSALHNLSEVEMGNLQQTRSKLSQKVKKNNDGGGDYSRASSRGDEEDPPISRINSVTEEDFIDDPFIDDDSHNKHTSRKRHLHNNGISPSPSVITATSTHTFPTFAEAIRERASWLIGLLFFQSCSSFIIAYNEQFLQTHMVIVQFLTMLVGAGGNAGNQSAVGVIRGLAIGTINGNTWRDYLRQEAKMAAGLSCLIGLTGFIRAALFRTPWGETIAITTSVAMIVLTSVAIGSTLPLGMKKVGIDPAHSSTTIQVIMDILGVLITVMVSSFVMSFAVFQNEDDGSVDDNTYKIDTADVGG
eukprot:scaffold5007_cov141-Skeletonema_menzelii.AAC.3